MSSTTTIIRTVTETAANKTFKNNGDNQQQQQTLRTTCDAPGRDSMDDSSNNDTISNIVSPATKNKNVYLVKCDCRLRSLFNLNINNVYYFNNKYLSGAILIKIKRNSAAVAAFCSNKIYNNNNNNSKQINKNSNKTTNKINKNNNKCVLKSNENEQSNSQLDIIQKRKNTNFGHLKSDYKNHVSTSAYLVKDFWNELSFWLFSILKNNSMLVLSVVFLLYVDNAIAKPTSNSSSSTLTDISGIKSVRFFKNSI